MPKIEKDIFGGPLGYKQYSARNIFESLSDDELDMISNGAMITIKCHGTEDCSEEILNEIMGYLPVPNGGIEIFVDNVLVHTTN